MVNRLDDMVKLGIIHKNDKGTVFTLKWQSILYDGIKESIAKDKDDFNLFTVCSEQVKKHHHDLDPFAEIEISYLVTEFVAYIIKEKMKTK